MPWPSLSHLANEVTRKVPAADPKSGKISPFLFVSGSYRRQFSYQRDSSKTRTSEKLRGWTPTNRLKLLEVRLTSGTTALGQMGGDSRGTGVN